MKYQDFKDHETLGTRHILSSMQIACMSKQSHLIQYLFAGFKSLPSGKTQFCKIWEFVENVKSMYHGYILKLLQR